ncbi:hypothetical protein LX36DRAFT_311555 [Colletotrichum falcatum]|nr:hypothetical protein LX36DRAFT_311555 [Colletotrichum falcatum]
MPLDHTHSHKTTLRAPHSPRPDRCRLHCDGRPKGGGGFVSACLFRSPQRLLLLLVANSFDMPGSMQSVSLAAVRSSLPMIHPTATISAWSLDSRHLTCNVIRFLTGGRRGQVDLTVRESRLARNRLHKITPLHIRYQATVTMVVVREKCQTNHG